MNRRFVGLFTIRYSPIFAGGAMATILIAWSGGTGIDSTDTTTTASTLEGFPTPSFASLIA